MRLLLLFSMIELLILFSLLQTTIEEAKKLVLVSENDQIERTTLILRSYIALGRYDEALQQIAALSSKSVLISAIELLANYFRDPENRSTYVEQMSVLINDEFSTSPLIPVIAATMFNNERDYEKAYRLLRSKSTFEQYFPSFLSFYSQDDFIGSDPPEHESHRSRQSCDQ